MNQDQDCCPAMKQRPQDCYIAQPATEVGCAGPNVNGCDQQIPRCRKCTVEISGPQDEWRGICCHADGGDRNKIVLVSSFSFLQEGVLDLGSIQLYREGIVERNVEGHMHYEGH